MQYFNINIHKLLINAIIGIMMALYRRQSIHEHYRIWLRWNIKFKTDNFSMRLIHPF